MTLTKPHPTLAKTHVDARLLSVDLAQAAGPIDIENIDREKSYRCLLQLGSHRRWRKCSGGCWARGEEIETASGQRLVRYQHVAALHEVGPLSGRTMQGVAQHHNDFLTENSTPTSEVRQDGERKERPNPEAVVNRMILCQDIRETDELPGDMPKKRRADFERRALNHNLQRIADALENNIKRGSK